MRHGSNLLPVVDINVDAVLLKADSSPECLTYSSSLSGLGYASNGQSLLIISDDGYIGRSVDDWRVIYQELGYMIEEAERWQRSKSNSCASA